jgi:hypothetical protein
MKKEDDCVSWCDKGLEISEGNENELSELKIKALHQKAC